MKNFGLSKDYLQNAGLLGTMLKGYKTSVTVPLTLNFDSAVLRTDARLSFQQFMQGHIVLAIHGIRKEPELDKPFFGHIFSEEDKKNLRETGNMGRIANLRTRAGEEIPSFISIDKLTNEVVALRVANAFIPDEVKGVRLTENEKENLKEGKAIYLEGMMSNKGKEFDGWIQINADRRGIEHSFESNHLFTNRTLYGVELSEKQMETLNDGKAIKLEGMKRKDRDTFDAFVSLDKTTGRPV